MLLKSVCTCTCQRLAWTASLCPCRDVAVHIPCGQWSVLILLNLIVHFCSFAENASNTCSCIFLDTAISFLSHVCKHSVTLSRRWLSAFQCLMHSNIINYIHPLPSPSTYIVAHLGFCLFIHTHTHIYKYLSLCVVYYSLWSKTLIILCFFKGMH